MADHPITIEIDLPCSHCGYNLRGLQTDASCPECATAASRSLLGEKLGAADPDWLRRLDRGIALMLVAVGAAIALGILFLVLKFWTTINLRSASARVAFGVAFWLVQFVLLGGAIMATAPDPRLRLAENKGKLRSILRGLGIVALVMATLSIVERLGAGFPGGAFLRSWFERVVALLLVIFVSGITFYFSTIARRLPDRKLEQDCRRTAILLILMPFILVPVQLLAPGPGVGVLEAEGFQRILKIASGALAIIWLVYMIQAVAHWAALRRLIRVDRRSPDVCV